MTVGNSPRTRRARTTPGGAERRWSLQPKKLQRLVSRKDPRREYFVYVPSFGAKEAPVFVAVHGISRNVADHASRFSVYCEQHGVVMVAPFFQEGHWADYQRLGREGRGPRADHALDAILEEVGLLTGTDTAQMHLFGFSGGAQFVHRYIMAHPHRVARSVVASAGWYTFPDPAERYPYGIRRCKELPELRFDPEEFLRVPITVMVGDRDITSEDLRNTKRVNRQQGATRLERAQNWVAAMQKAARAHQLDSLVKLETIPGGDHSFSTLMLQGGLGSRVFTALFGSPIRETEAGDRG